MAKIYRNSFENFENVFSHDSKKNSLQSYNYDYNNTYPSSRNSVILLLYLVFPFMVIW